jgi:hypothetical protein
VFELNELSMRYWSFLKKNGHSEALSECGAVLEAAVLLNIRTQRRLISHSSSDNSCSTVHWGKSLTGVIESRAMAQAGSRQPPTTEAWVCVGPGAGFSQSSSGFLCKYNTTVAFDCHIIRGMNNRPVGGRSSETYHLHEQQQKYQKSLTSKCFNSRLICHTFSYWTKLPWANSRALLSIILYFRGHILKVTECNLPQIIQESIIKLILVHVSSVWPSL